MVIYNIDMVILDIDTVFGLMLWEMMVSIWSSSISIWDILSLWMWSTRAKSTRPYLRREVDVRGEVLQRVDLAIELVDDGEGGDHVADDERDVARADGAAVDEGPAATPRGLGFSV
jgi:hypothetical protein